MVELIIAVITVAGCIYYVNRQKESMSQKTINGLFIAALIALTVVIGVIQRRIENASVDRAMKQRLIDLLEEQNQISKRHIRLLDETLEHSRKVLDHVHNHNENHQAIVEAQKDIVVKMAAINKRLEAVSTYGSLGGGEGEDLSNKSR